MIANKAGYLRVQGKCPACGAEFLFLGSEGYVTCSVIGCKDPGAPTDLLLGLKKTAPEPKACPTCGGECRDYRPVMKVRAQKTHERYCQDNWHNKPAGDGS